MQLGVAYQCRFLLSFRLRSMPEDDIRQTDPAMKISPPQHRKLYMGQLRPGPRSKLEDEMHSLACHLANHTPTTKAQLPAGIRWRDQGKYNRYEIKTPNRPRCRRVNCRRPAVAGSDLLGASAQRELPQLQGELKKENKIYASTYRRIHHQLRETWIGCETPVAPG